MVALAAVVAAAIATAVAVTVAHHGRAARPQALPPPGNGALPETIHLAHPALMVPANRELIARGPQLLRINLRTGMVVRTEVPTLQSTGPSFLIVQAHRVWSRPSRSRSAPRGLGCRLGSGRRSDGRWRGSD